MGLVSVQLSSLLCRLGSFAAGPLACALEKFGGAAKITIVHVFGGNGTDRSGSTSAFLAGDPRPPTAVPDSN